MRSRGGLRKEGGRPPPRFGGEGGARGQEDNVVFFAEGESHHGKEGAGVTGQECVLDFWEKGAEHNKAKGSRRPRAVRAVGCVGGGQFDGVPAGPARVNKPKPFPKGGRACRPRQVCFYS